MIAGLKSHQYIPAGRDIKVIVAASTGVAAELLFEGATVHRKFYIGRELEDDTPVKISRHSNAAEFMRAVNVIIIDEITMLNNKVVSYIDRLLRDANNTTQDFGGKVVVWSGDFKQILPVAKGVQGGDSLHAAAMASVKNSKWFKDPAHKFKTHKLTRNYRLKPGQQEYLKFLHNIGHGLTWIDDDYNIELEEKMCLNTQQQMIDFVYPKEVLENALDGYEELAGRAILCPINETVFDMNEKILDMLPKEWPVYI